MDKCLVTGGAGFIGSNLAFTLEKEGLKVVVWDNLTSGCQENLAGIHGPFYQVDITQPQSFPRDVTFDAIFHQAAITDTTVTNEKAMRTANVDGFRNILTYAQHTGCTRVVYASSAGVYGAGHCPMREDQARQPHNIYARSKCLMEDVADAFTKENPSFVLVGLRYFNVYGSRESSKGTAASMVYQLFDQMRSGRRPRLFKYGEQYRDFIYIEDVVRANLLALKVSQSLRVNVGTGRPSTFNQIVAILNRCLGTSWTPEYFENPYSGYQNETLADATLAKRLLGFEAHFGLEEGIRDYLRKLTHALPERTASKS